MDFGDMDMRVQDYLRLLFLLLAALVRHAANSASHRTAALRNGRRPERQPGEGPERVYPRSAAALSRAAPM